MNISDSKIIRGLDKDLGAGLYDQAEAFFKIDTFNTQNKFKKKYLATVRLTSFGKYAVYVVPNTLANREALNEAVYKANLKNQLSTLIKNNQASQKFCKQIFFFPFCFVKIQTDLCNKNEKMVCYFGCKRNILQSMADRGVYAKVFPAKTSIEECLN